MSRHLVNVDVKEVKAAAWQSASLCSDLTHTHDTAKTWFLVFDTYLVVYTICHCCHTYYGKLIAFLQKELGYWSVTRPFLSAKGGNARLVPDTPAITTKALAHWCFDCKSGFITTEIQLLCQQANSSSVKVMKHLNSNPICNRSTLCSLNFVFDVSKSLSPLKLWYCELDCYA